MRRPGSKCSNILLCILLLLISMPMWSQQVLTPGSNTSFPAPRVTFEAKVREVPLVFSVVDHKGRFIDHLSPSDLQVFDNSEEQRSITYFEHQTNLPLNVAILIDVSSSVFYRFVAEQNAVKSFIHSVTRDSDQVNVYTFNNSVKFVSSDERSWKEVSRKLRKLKPEGDTALYDALAEVANNFRDDGPARKVIILVTDGEENKSRNTLENSVSRVLKAECAVYAINVSPITGADDDPQKREAQSVLKYIADATGGSYFNARAEGYVSDAFSKIRRELRSQYLMAYRPGNFESRPFHRIQVVTRKKLKVHCRSGYYAQ